MKAYLLAGAAVVACCSVAQAASIAFTPYVSGGSFYAPMSNNASGLSQKSGSSLNNYQSPFNDTTTVYDVVSANGSATFGGAATNSGSFGVGGDTLSFLWGSPDSFNTLAIYSGTTEIASFTGAGEASGTYLATVSGLGSYDQVVFSSGENAFEFAAVSPVPLPAGLPMFGLGLLGLGGLAFLRQRRTKTGTIAG